MKTSRPSSISDPAFTVDIDALSDALVHLGDRGYKRADPETALASMPDALPESGAGERELLDQLAALVLGGGCRLDDPLSFAHMDPPTPWLTWATTLWNARLNQNLLHPATAPVARAIEQRTVEWLAPFFGMDGGHVVPGSTVANLTAIWAARDLCGVQEVVAPETAHVSIRKAAHILGLKFRPMPTDREGRLLPDALGDLDRACLVLVAGATSTGVVDPLRLAGTAAWTHVDAAWAGPLRLSKIYASRLDGVEKADSVAVSAHKWLFQPKESALVFFRRTQDVHAQLSFGGAYLATPNIGLLGSHGATAVPIFSLLWAWGREGLAARLERCMAASEAFADFIDADPRFELFSKPETGVVVWRPVTRALDEFSRALPSGLASQTKVAGNDWLRCVSANPSVDVKAVIDAVRNAI